MPIYSTDWSNTSINSTNFSGSRNNESIHIGSPIGLLLTLTWNQSIDSSAVDYSTNYSTLSSVSTNWGNDNVFIDQIELQNGDILILQNDEGLLIP